MEKFLVRIPEGQRQFSFEVHEWLLEHCKHDEYELLYRHWTPADGKWQSGPKSEVVYVEFDNEDDAMAFKLRWI